MSTRRGRWEDFNNSPNITFWLHMKKLDEWKIWMNNEVAKFGHKNQGIWREQDTWQLLIWCTRWRCIVGVKGWCKHMRSNDHCTLRTWWRRETDIGQSRLFALWHVFSTHHQTHNLTQAFARKMSLLSPINSCLTVSNNALRAIYSLLAPKRRRL